MIPGGWIGSYSSVASLPLIEVSYVRFFESIDTYGIFQNDVFASWVLCSQALAKQLREYGGILPGRKSVTSYALPCRDISHCHSADRIILTYMNNNPTRLLRVMLCNFLSGQHLVRLYKIELRGSAGIMGR